MSKLTTIDRDACRILRNAINDCLAKISDEHGIRFSAGSGSFDSGQVTFKVECALVNNGEVLSKETTDFKRYAAMFGLSPDDLGREFFHSGKRYKIVGCKPQSRKYPILCEQISTGKRIKFPEETVKFSLKMANVSVK